MVKKFFAFILLSFLYVQSFQSFLWAEETDNAVLSYIAAPDEYSRFQKPLSLVSYQTDPFSGSFNTSVAIDVPPARGITPSVGLSYNSSREGTIAPGWDIAQSYIRRSTRFGTPLYTDSDIFEFSIGNCSGELAAVGPDNQGNAVYRAKREGCFMKFVLDSSGRYWTVYDKEGTVWKFGEDARDKETVNGIVKTYAWYVSEVTDIDGNEIHYEYTAQDGMLYLDTIRYGMGNGAKPELCPYVSFGWHDKPRPTRISYTKGFCSVIDSKRLGFIMVGGFDEKGAPSTRIYNLCYGDENGNSVPVNYSGKMYLTDVIPEGLPEHTFSYYPESGGFTEDSTVDVKTIEEDDVRNKKFPLSVDYGIEFTRSFDPGEHGSSYNSQCFDSDVDSVEHTINKLVDMDGDGDLDLVVVDTAEYTDFDPDSDTAHWYWRENVDGEWYEDHYIKFKVTDIYENEDYVENVSAAAFRAYWYYESISSDQWLHVMDHEYHFDPRGITVKKTRKIDVSKDYIVDDTDPGFEDLKLGEKAHIITQDMFDINSDGKADFVYYKNCVIMVCKGLGDGRFDTPSEWFNIYTADKYYSTNKFFTRMAYFGLSYTGVYKEFDADDGDPVQTWDGNEYDVLYKNHQRIGMEDINGDGYVDLMIACLEQVDSTLRWTGWNVFLNTGSGFKYEPFVIKLPPLLVSMLYGGSLHTRWIFVKTEIKTGDKFVAVHIPETNKNKITTEYQWVEEEYSLSESTFYDTTSSIDMNGDGLKDLVINQVRKEDFSKNNVVVYYGKGNGFDFDDSLCLESFGIRQIGTGVNSSYAADRPDIVRDYYELNGFNDLNGDGLPDFCSNTGVWFNYGTGFSNWHDFDTTIESFPGTGHICPGPAGDFILGDDDDVVWSRTKRLLVDFDGDGQKDLLYWDAGNKTLIKYSPQAQPAGKMRLCTNSAGLTTEIKYALVNDEDAKIPYPLWAVSEITSEDRFGVTTKSFIRTFKPYYETAKGQREFRGFGKVEENQNNEKFIVNCFYQDEFNFGKKYRTAVTNGSLLVNGTVQFEGKETIIEYKEPYWFYNGAGAQVSAWIPPYSITTKTYDLANPDPATEKQVRYYYFDNDPEKVKLGLLRGRRDEGYLQPGNDQYDDRNIEFDYEWENTDSRYIVRKVSERVYDMGANTKSKVEWHYDPSDNWHLDTETVWLGKAWSNEDDAYAVTSYTYDSYGRKKTVTDPDGCKVTYSYYSTTPFVWFKQNDLGHTTFYEDYHALIGQPGTVYGPSYKMVDGKIQYARVKTTRDKYGRTISQSKSKDFSTEDDVYCYLKTEFEDAAVEDTPAYVHSTVFPDGENVQDASPARESYTYFNGRGNAILKAVKHPDGWTKDYYEYDAFGRLHRAYKSFISSTNSYIKTEPVNKGMPCYVYLHDTLDRITETIDFNSYSTRAVYEKNTVSVYDQEDHMTKYTYNGFGEITEVSKYVEGLDCTTSYGYDAKGRLTRTTDPDGGVYYYYYYGNGTLKESYLPGNKNWMYFYTPGGKVEKVTAREEGEVVSDYDEYGRLETRKVFDITGAVENKEEYEYYDASTPEMFGLLKKVITSDYEIELTYDAHRQVASKTLIDYESGTPLTWAKSYNLIGETAEMSVQPLNDGKIFRYDVSGNIFNITGSTSNYNNGNTQHTKYEFDMQYCADGELDIVTGNITDAASDRKLDIVRDYIYHNDGALQSINSSIGGKMWNVSYEYFPDGMIEHASSNYEYLFTYDNHYLYDVANRLNNVIVEKSPNASGLPGNYIFTYNKNSSIKSASVDNLTWEYAYTDSANHTLRALTSYDGDNWRFHDYDYSVNGQRIYDHYQDMTTSTGEMDENNIQSLSWSGDGKLAKTTINDAITGEQTISDFWYDYTGSRWKRKVTTYSGVTTSLYLDGIVEAEISNDTTEYYSYTGVDNMTFTRKDDDIRCYVNDMLNTSYVFGFDGKLYYAGTHTPYGSRCRYKFDSEEKTSKFSFNGKEEEPVSGLLYYGARYYDPASRQWLSVDPMRMAGAGNTILEPEKIQPYTYCSSNPVSRFDPDGMDSFPCEGLIRARLRQSFTDAKFWLTGQAQNTATALKDPRLGNSALLATGTIALGAVAILLTGGTAAVLLATLKASLIAATISTGATMVIDGAMQASGDAPYDAGRTIQQGLFAFTGTLGSVFGIAGKSYFIEASVKQFAEKLGTNPIAVRYTTVFLQALYGATYNVVNDYVQGNDLYFSGAANGGLLWLGFLPGGPNGPAARLLGTALGNYLGILNRIESGAGAPTVTLDVDTSLEYDNGF